MATIVRSVGRGGFNREDDVKLTQQLLNLAIESIDLKEDGKAGPATVSAIDFFQGHIMGIRSDGRIEPNGATLIMLNNKAKNPQCIQERIDLPAPVCSNKLNDNDFKQAANLLGCEVAVVRAVTEVESNGSGFLPSGRPKILFEAHHFSRLTYHCFDVAYPDISSKSQNTRLYRGGEAECERLIKAMAINRTAALQSASWGMFQIMGFNYQTCGYDSVQMYVENMYKSELHQLLAFVNFIKKLNYVSDLKNKNWTSFAIKYNGRNYTQNAYDTKLLSSYNKFAGSR